MDVSKGGYNFYRGGQKATRILLRWPPDTISLADIR
jgi:hypothetical protein